jgi:hypothetical protein
MEVDVAAEKARLAKEAARLQGEGQGRASWATKPSPPRRRRR